ncbi:MAG: T9SS C-terminal target domain-containing protein, partial [Bacteroidetes bacterium]
LEEDCSSPPCAPVSRERYAWEQGVATRVKPAIGKVRALPNPLPAGSYLPLDGAEGQAYRIIDLQGRLWQSGEVPSHHPLIPLPTEPGLYLLQIGGTQHKLLLLR